MSIKNIKPTGNSPYHQSYFFPENKDKMIGSYPIICRSLLERKVCIYLDTNSNITKWASEPFSIKYLNLMDNKEHNYYPDFIFMIGEQKVVVEVKPRRQLIKPKEPKRKTEKSIKNYNISMEMYLKNFSKITAIKNFAEKNNFKFLLLTEKEIDKLIQSNIK